MEKKTENNALSLGDIIAIVRNNWLWYLLSLLICIAIAYYQVKITQPVYERHALVLIKSRGAISQMQDEAAAFSEIGLSSAGGYLVDNEILVFKSRRLMAEVVRRLNLDVDYSQHGHFRDWTMYSSTPVKLVFPDAEEEQRFSLTMTPMGNHKVKLHEFSIGGKGYDKEVISHIGDTVNTPVGRVVAVPNTASNPNGYVGTDIHVRKSPLKKVAESYSGRLQSTQATKTSTIIKLALNDQSTKRAEDVLNTLVQVYDEDAIKDKNRVAVNTEKFIAEQLEVLESELDDVDAIIANYKATNRLTDLSSDASSYRSMMNTVEQRSADLQNQRSVANYILDYIQRREGIGEAEYEVIPNNAGLNNSQVESLISEYNQQTMLREKLKADAGENNPQVQDLTNSIDQMRTRIVASIHNLVQSLDIEIQNVDKRVGASRNRLVAVPTQQKTVTSVQRQQSTKEQLYLYLLNKQQENALAKSITESNARILDPAIGSDAPISPQKSNIFLTALVIGLLIPTAVLAILLMTDTKIRSKKDLTVLGDLPLVGEIPQAGGKWTNRNRRQHGHSHLDIKDAIVVTAESKDSVSESVRILRTNLHYFNGKNETEARVIMLTSFLPGAGKTFVTSNLSMSMALAGKKVVMVDLDIRRGSLSAGLGKDICGVTDYICGFETNLDKIIIHTAMHENLDMIPTGHKAPNPAELLMDERLEMLIDALKERYDYIILDSVPVNLVADATICNRVADLTLFIIRAGNLDKRMLPEVARLYEENKLKKMSLVLNGVSDSRIYGSGYGYYGYGYYGYHGYGYYGYRGYGYYGYGDDGRKKSKKKKNTKS